MITAPFSYYRARDLDDARTLLRDAGSEAKILAGGMSLIPLMKTRLAQPEALVDIAGIDELRGVRSEAGQLRVGALTTHAQLAVDPVVAGRLPVLAQMARDVGDAQVRHRGTIGGVLAHADCAGDYCVLALMLDATIVTDRTEYAASDFFVDFMTTPLAEDEVILEVRFPVETGRHDYLKFRRRSTDWAMVGVAVQESADGWRVGLTNVAGTPVRGTAAEVALAGGAGAEAAAGALADAIEPLGDASVPAEYKRWLVRVLTKRVLGGLGVS